MPPLPASVRGFGQFDAGLARVRPEEIRRRLDEGHAKLEKFLQIVAEAQRVIVLLEEDPVVPRGTWAEWKSVSTQVTNGWKEFAAIRDRLKIQMGSLLSEDADPVPFPRVEVEKILSKSKLVSTKLIEQAVTLLSLHYHGLDEVREISPKLREFLFNIELEPRKARIAELEARELIVVESQQISATQQELRETETSLQQMLLESFGGENSVDTLRDLIHEWADYKARIGDLNKGKKETDKRLAEWEVKHDANLAELSNATTMLKETKKVFRRTQDKYVILESDLEAKTRQLNSEISRRKRRDERIEKILARAIEREEAAEAKVNKVAELQEEAIISEDRIKRLTASVADYEAQMPQLGQIINDLLNGYSLLVTRHDEFVEKTSSNLENLNGVLKVMEQAGTDNDNKWCADLAAKSTELKESEESRSECEDRLRRLSILYSARSDELENITSSNQEQRKRLTLAEKANSEQSTELFNIRTTYAAQSEKLEEMTTKFVAQSAELEDMKRGTVGKDEKLEALEFSVRTKSLEMERRDQTLSDQSAEIRDLKTRLNAAQEDFQKSSATFSSQNKLLQCEQTTVLQNFEKISSLTETVRDLRNDMSNLKVQVQNLTMAKTFLSEEVARHVGKAAEQEMTILGLSGEVDRHADKAIEQSTAIGAHIKTVEGLQNALQLKQDEITEVRSTYRKAKDDYKTNTNSLQGTILDLQANRTMSINHAARLLSFVTVGKAPEIMSSWLEIVEKLIFDVKPELVLEASQSWWIVNVPFDTSLLCLEVMEHHGVLNVILLYLFIAEGKSSDPLASKYLCELSRHISGCSATIFQMAVAVVECYCSTLSAAANSEEESIFALSIFQIVLAIRQRNSTSWQVFGIRLEADIHQQLEAYITNGPALINQLYQAIKFTTDEVSSQDAFTKSIWAAVNTAFDSCLDYRDTILATNSSCPYLILTQAQNETVFTLVGKKHINMDTSIEFMHIGDRYLLNAADGASLESLIFQEDRKTRGPNHWWADNVVRYMPGFSNLSQFAAEIKRLEESGELEDLDLATFDYPGL